MNTIIKIIVDTLGGDAPKNANIDLYEPDSEHGPLSWIMNNVHIY